MIIKKIKHMIDLEATLLNALETMQNSSNIWNETW